MCHNRLGIHSPSTGARIESLSHYGLLDLTSEVCGFELEGESLSPEGHGAGDALECVERSFVKCSSDECSLWPCHRHVKYCPNCGQPFCDSSRRSSLWTCFYVHVRDGCQTEILRVPIDRLAHELHSGKHPDLGRFVNRDSDGLGHPLPVDVCRSFGFAVACAADLIPEYNQDVLVEQQEARLRRKAERQRIRRAAIRNNVSVDLPRVGGRHLSPHRNSTTYLATGALITRHWTGNWHYREQAEILELMGLAKGPDFIRDRVAYLRDHNRAMFDMIQSRAAAMRAGPPNL